MASYNRPSGWVDGRNVDFLGNDVIARYGLNDMY